MLDSQQKLPLATEKEADFKRSKNLKQSMFLTLQSENHYTLPITTSLPIHHHILRETVSVGIYRFPSLLSPDRYEPG
jgi:hypothetical protein